VIFIGRGLDELSGEVADVLADGGVEGPLAHAALAAINETATVAVRRRALMRHTVTPLKASCRPPRFSFRSGSFC
jgi:hypothetical protein